MRIIWLASSTCPGVRCASGVRMASCTFSGNRLYFAGSNSCAVRFLERADLLAPLLNARFDIAQFSSIRGRFRGRRQRLVDLDVAEQRRLQLVVILLRDRVEFVIVAARALHGQPEDAAAERSDHVVQVFVAVLRIVFLAEADLGVAAQKARGDQAVGG